MSLTIDGDWLLRGLEALGQIGASPAGGMDRVAFSPADMEARVWVEARMREMDMTVHTDPAGNTIGTYPGSEPHLTPIALGSHTDSVPNGGRYDGALGVVAAVACIRALREAGIHLSHPVEVINFTAEEATMAGGTLGSMAMVGMVDPARLERPAWNGRPVAQHLRSAGLEPAGVVQAARKEGCLAAYLELHVEQGGVLAAAGVPIGVVEGIVGIRRYTVTFRGYANHAGTTPMEDRRDALVMASSFILRVRDAVMARGIVGTVGTVQVQPGTPNVIPGQVELSLEIRGPNETVLDRAESDLARSAIDGGADFTSISQKPPVASDPRIMEAVTASCEALDLPYRRMWSGAGHDAMCVAAIAPQAMIFVPSREGVSHSPDEFTHPESCVIGAQILLAALLRLDAELDPKWIER